MTLWNTTCRMLALDNAFSQWARFSDREMRHWNQATQSEVDVLSGCFWLARHDAVKKVGNLDERFFFYAEDLDWCKRFRDAGWKVVFVPEATATHFGGGSSANAPLRYSIEMLRANLAYWRKHCGAPGLAVFFFLSVIHHTIRLLIRTAERVFGKNLTSNDSVYKCQRSLVCLRWLLTGKGV
jgi:GT2 family glycosyltransferase